MEIDLRPELAKFIEERVKAGEYQSASDVVNDAIERLKHTPGWTQDELRRELMIGAKQADRGEFVEHDLDRIIAEGRRRLAARREHP